MDVNNADLNFFGRNLHASFNSNWIIISRDWWAHIRYYVGRLVVWHTFAILFLIITISNHVYYIYAHFTDFIDFILTNDKPPNSWITQITQTRHPGS